MAIDLSKLFNSKKLSPEQERYYVVANEFYKKFGERIPREVYPATITDADIIAAMETCIKTGKNNLSEMLHVRINKDLIY